MSKLKLFLLGGIFTLVGIFNFSSAETITVSSTSPGVYSPGSYTFEQPFNSYNIENVVCDGRCEITFYFGNGWSNSCKVTNSTIETSTCLSSKDFVGYVHWEGPTNATSFTSFDFVLPDPEIVTVLSGGYSSLSPAINGLFSVVFQFIPFVVYISIGILIAVVGFYAIKWLCNWFLIKINSVFKSKRG